MRNVVDTYVADGDYVPSVDIVASNSSSVVAPGDVVADVLNDKRERRSDIENIVVDFSPYRQEDNTVQVADNFNERADFYGSRVLWVDDLIESGTTWEKTSMFLFNQGVEEIYGITAMAKMNKWDRWSDNDLIKIYQQDTGDVGAQVVATP